MIYILLKKAFAVFLALITFLSNTSFLSKEARPADESAIRVHYGDGECEYYDMFLPNKDGGEVDVVFMIHGGAWCMGDQTEFSEDCKTAANEYGYVAVTVDYNKILDGNTSAGMVDEMYKAVESVKDNLIEKGFSADKMVVAGHSAGAHIALLYSYMHYADSPIDIGFVVSNSAPSDFFDDSGSGNTTMEKYAYLAVSGLIGELVLPGHENDVQDKIINNNPIDLVTNNVPPTIVVYGQKDEMVSPTNSENLFAKLQDNGVASDVVIYPDAGHFLEDDAVSDGLRADTFFSFAKLYL